MMSWSRPPSGFSDELEKLQNQRLRAAALQALTGVIERSPVDTGAFRGNNRVSVGSRDHGYNLSDKDKSGAATMAQGSTAIQTVRKPFTVIYVQNNLPHAETIEFGKFTYKPGGKTTPGGYSIQAPQGVYAVTFNNLKNGVDRGF